MAASQDLVCVPAIFMSGGMLTETLRGRARGLGGMLRPRPVAGDVSEDVRVRDMPLSLGDAADMSSDLGGLRERSRSRGGRGESGMFQITTSSGSSSSLSSYSASSSLMDLRPGCHDERRICCGHVVVVADSRRGEEDSE